MQAKAEALSATGKDVYFGVGIARDPKFTGRTKSGEVIGIPGVWLDIDIKHETHKEVDLPETIAEIETKLPLAPSVIVHSGHGLHAYWLFREPWFFDDEVEHRRAEQLAQGFQRYVKEKLGYKLDATHDLARVLRLPGTMNYKTAPVSVEILQETAARYNIDDLEQFAVETPGTLPTCNAPRSGFKRLPTDDLSAVVLENCRFIRHCRDDAANLTYNEWLAMITNVVRCKDGPETVHALSKAYPRYSFTETDHKIADALRMDGPISCGYIQSTLGFQGCPSAGCGVKAPCGFALRNALEKVAATENTTPSKHEANIKAEAKLEALTDLGNAERFARMFKDRLKYCHQFGTWLIWDGVRHKIDEQEQVMLFAREAVRSFIDDIPKLYDADKRKDLFKHAQKSESLPRLKAMTELAQSMLPVHVDALDGDKWLLNVQNGVVDLRTGRLQPHDSARLITKLAPVVYDAAAQCPCFLQFLNDIFGANEAIVGFMQRLLGYSLTGDTSEQVMSFAYGALGSNGKSTLLELFLNLLGDYGETTGSDTFTLKRNEGIPNDIARLRGARFVKISELKENTKLNEALIKQVTGQDRLTARFLRQEFFTFLPAFKLMILTNHKPKLTGDDPALWRRILLIPFLERFTGEKKDKLLPEKLDRERSGILNWCIEGCLAWQESGLNPPDEVLNATRQFQDESDILTSWLEDCCLVKPYLQARSAALFRSFEDWCEENGERNYLSRNKFTQKLTEKGFVTYKGAKGVRFIKGLALLDLERDIDSLHTDTSAEEPF